MTRPILALGAAALAFTAANASGETPAEKGEAKFAELTEGRVAGEPKSCINAFRSNNVDVIEYVGISYKDGDTLWIAKASNPSSLGRNDVPIFDRFGSQICRQDVIRTVDRYSQFTTGTVFLEDFVPYEKAESADS